MNATNRGLNRAILFTVGILMIGLGGAMVLAMWWPVAGELWLRWSAIGREWLVGAEQASRLAAATTVSWLTIAILVLLLVMVTIAVVVIARLGGGRSNVVIREDAGTGVRGSVTIRQEFVADAVTQSLASYDEILSSKVNARRLRGADILHVSVTPRQNVSPADVSETLAELIDRLGVLMGQEIPTIVTIQAGIRSRLAADKSRVN